MLFFLIKYLALAAMHMLIIFVRLLIILHGQGFPLTLLLNLLYRDQIVYRLVYNPDLSNYLKFKLNLIFFS